MHRRNILQGIAALLASTATTTQAKTVSPTAKQVCTDLLRLANKVQNAQLSKADRDAISEQLASMCNQIQTRYNVPALCSTDTECRNKLGE